jgi:hypothetical protein
MKSGALTDRVRDGAATYAHTRRLLVTALPFSRALGGPAPWSRETPPGAHQLERSTQGDGAAEVAALDEAWNSAGPQFLAVEPAWHWAPDAVCGLDWSFSDRAHGDADVPTMVREIQSVMALDTPRHAVRLTDHVPSLSDRQLTALRLAGHAFGGTAGSDAALCAAREANVRALTWMRTRGAFARGDASAPWLSRDLIIALSSARLCTEAGGAATTGEICREPGIARATARLQRKVRDIEACVDLVYDRRYWTCPEDDVAFPFSEFLGACCEDPSKTAVLEWFLNRAQFRYPMPRFGRRLDERLARDNVQALADRGEAILSRKLGDFIATHSRLRPPTLRASL